MGLRARSIVFWPGMTHDIERRRQSCLECVKNAPTQPSLPPVQATPPSTPLEQIYADFFDCIAQHYLVVGDRLSGWCDVFRAPKGSPQAGSEGLIHCLRNYFSRFGVPEELSSDGGPEFVANATQEFLSRWGVRHRLSSAYNPQSNGRAEVAVKTAKRLLRSNTDSSGTLNTDQFLRAMMQLQNSPDPDCNKSPAEIVFGRPVRDAFGFINRLEKFSNSNVHPVWREAWKLKEEALRQRFHHSAEGREEHCRSLPDLEIGDRCYIQNQTGPRQKRWDRSGTVVEAHGNSSYALKVDGTDRVTRRNRRYLQKFTPASPDITNRGAFAKHVPTPLFKMLPTRADATPSPSPYSPSAPSVRHTPSIEEEVPAQQLTSPLQSSPSQISTDVQPPTDEPQSTTAPTHDVPQTRGDSVTQTHADDVSKTRNASPRPTRIRKPPRRFVPETGSWD